MQQLLLLNTCTLGQETIFIENASEINRVCLTLLLIRTDSREIIYPQIRTRVHRMNWIWYGDALNLVIISFIWLNFYCPNINTTICYGVWCNSSVCLLFNGWKNLLLPPLQIKQIPFWLIFHQEEHTWKRWSNIWWTGEDRKNIRMKHCFLIPSWIVI